jgi:hypothetical protein
VKTFCDPTITAVQPVPVHTYRLYDGSSGTQYQFLLETIKMLRYQQQTLEDKIEDCQRKLETAEGHP